MANLVEPGSGPLPEHIPFSPAAKRTLELTLRQALRLGHNYIGTEHILLAVLDDDTPTAVVLSGLGVDRDQAEAWLIEQLARASAGDGPGEALVDGDQLGHRPARAGERVDE